MNTDPSLAVTGKTLRFTWTDGPTKGTTHEHVFHQDGTVEWRDPSHGDPKGAQGDAPERPKFLDEGIANGIRLVSYLSKAGYTLTVVLNYQTKLIAGIASNDKTWMPVHGSFEVV